MSDLSDWAGLDPRDVDRLLIEMGCKPPPVPDSPLIGLFQQQPSPRTWTEVTPRGVMQVTWDGVAYLIGGTLVPASEYQRAIRTGLW